MPALAGCGGRPSSQARVTPYSSQAPIPQGPLPQQTPVYATPPNPSSSWQPAVAGLDAVIDISHNVTVSDFGLVRQSGILAVIHKTTEGGDWFDPSYPIRRMQAEAAGLLWGGYHFGTRQYSGARQAATFLKAVQPGPSTLLALDFEPNDLNPGNTMSTHQAEEFVRAIHQATGRLPVVYTHAAWANGRRFGRRGLRLMEPINPTSILARCDLWLADLNEQPEVPYAWERHGWRLWQYVANESANDAAYGAAPRAIPGVTHCDRNLFAGDAAALYRFWKGGGRAGV